jgi:hypothetical protein
LLTQACAQRIEETFFRRGASRGLAYTELKQDDRAKELEAENDPE